MSQSCDSQQVRPHIDLWQELEETGWHKLHSSAAEQKCLSERPETGFYAITAAVPPRWNLPLAGGSAQQEPGSCSDRAKSLLPAGAFTGTSAPAQRRGGFLGVCAHNTNSSSNYHFQLGEENCLMSSLLRVGKNVQESDFRSVLIPVQKAIHSQVLIAERRDLYSQGNSSEGLSPMSFNSPLSF